MAKFKQLAETTNLMKLNSLEPLLPCYSRCLAAKTTVARVMETNVHTCGTSQRRQRFQTRWQVDIRNCHFSRIHCMSCILELQSGFAQKPYWRARVSTGHPNRSWTLHSLSHASPACKASPQFQFRRTVTNVFQVTHPTNWANQCSEKLVPYTSLGYSTLFKPNFQRSNCLGCCCKGQHWNGCMCSYPNGVVHNLEVVSVIKIAHLFYTSKCKVHQISPRNFEVSSIGRRLRKLGIQLDQQWINHRNIHTSMT